MRVFAGFVSVLASTVFAMGPAMAEPPVAGTQPSERPRGVAEITTIEKGAEWYERALTGVVPPYPGSLRFLEDQGAWYTPFDHPGMTGPYDIRSWHAEE